jgi:hypothetical protein
MRKSKGGRFTPSTRNLQGNHRGSCLVCRRGTDSGMGFHGPAEWALAGMQRLGVPSDEAQTVLANALNDPLPDPTTHFAPGRVPRGVFTTQLRVCAACAESSGSRFTVAPIALGVPIYECPDESP